MTKMEQGSHTEGPFTTLLGVLLGREPAAVAAIVETLVAELGGAKAAADDSRRAANEAAARYTEACDSLQHAAAELANLGYPVPGSEDGAGRTERCDPVVTIPESGQIVVLCRLRGTQEERRIYCGPAECWSEVAQAVAAHRCVTDGNG